MYEKSRIVKRTLAAVMAVSFLGCLMWGANAQSGSYTTTQTVSADHVLGSGNNRAETHYHVGSGWPYDDAKVTSVVGNPGFNYYRLTGYLHTPGTTKAYTYDSGLCYPMWDSEQSMSATTPSADTGIGYCTAQLWKPNLNKSVQELQYGIRLTVN